MTSIVSDREIDIEQRVSRPLRRSTTRMTARKVEWMTFATRNTQPEAAFRGAA